jgi:hypothetical protein
MLQHNVFWWIHDLSNVSLMASYCMQRNVDIDPYFMQRRFNCAYCKQRKFDVYMI